MPLRRSPPSLASLSETSVAEGLTSRWLEDATFLERRWEDERDFLATEVPGHALRDSLVARLVDAFSRQRHWLLRPSQAPFLVRAVSVPGLRTLDLSPLVRLGCVADEDLRLFEEQVALMTTQQHLVDLETLSLSTHKNEFTLPACSDAVMAAVALGCPRLRVLDVSCCSTVTDQGLLTVAQGCPLLERLMVFECSVTGEGVALLLERLPELRLVDYRDLCGPIVQLHSQGHSGPLKLTHVNNVGSPGAPPQQLRFTRRAATAVASLCPDLANLRVRVTDGDVASLRRCSFPALRALELVFNVGTPTSPGGGTASFLVYHGRNLSCLTLVCNVITAEQLVLVARACNHLRQLWVKSNDLLCAPDWQPPPPTTTEEDEVPVFTRLESFYAKVSRPDRHLPAHLLAFLLRDASRLTSLQLIARSASVSDTWLREVLTSAPTAEVVKLLVAVPGVNDASGSPPLGGLTIASARLALEVCPRLRTLGNLVAWNVGHGQYAEIRDKLRASNYDCEVVYRRMRIS